MTAIDVRTPQARRRLERLEGIWQEPRGLGGWLTTTDHKRIALMYLVTSLAFFAAGGAEALAMRTQLARPNERLLSPETYDQFMTMHGVTMIFFFVIPLSTGFFGNYLIPLMIGARDMAFPRLNALSYWIYLASGLFVYTAVLMHRAPNQGWFSYVPLADSTYNPGPNVDFYNLGLILNSISTTVAAVNFVVTLVRHRAPGMSLNRMPLFCWAMLATSFSLVFALPSLTLANILLELDRKAGMHFFDAARGGDPLLWQHLFWFFGHPEVYIIVLPAFGIATSIIPTFARRRMVAYPLVALAEVMVAFIGFGVWVHHMFATGLPRSTLLYFAAASLVIVIPSGIQIFAWCMTLVTGRPEYRTPLLFIVGFIVFFVVGGLSGISFALVPVDQQLTDTYYVVAHFHYVIWGAAVFPVLGGLYYWWPKVTGRMYNELAGQISFWLVFAGTNLTFFPMHIQGIEGMPRRVYTYPASMGWSTYNLIETVGGYIIAAGLLLQLGTLIWAARRGPRAGANPWNAPTLEWRTTSPPPAYNFAVVPSVSSAYPAWDEGAVEIDQRRLERGELVLDGGHETPATTLQDGWQDEVLDMPSGSAAPIVLAFFLVLAATMTLTSHYLLACGALGLVALTLAVWHAREAPSPVAAAAALQDRRRLSPPSGWWGMLIGVASEAALFGLLIGAYYYLRFHDLHWPLPGDPKPELVVPLVLAFVLLATSVPMQLAVRSARRLRLGRARALLLTALLVQTGYLAMQLRLYVDDLHKLPPSHDAYASVYATLLGLHHAHVFIGLLLTAWIAARLFSGLTEYRLTGLRSTALYWHVVNVLGLVVTGVILSARV